MASYVPRTVSPVGSYNPCFMTNLYGASWDEAWNTCIYGRPEQVGANVLSNCTGYAQGRSIELWQHYTGENPIATQSHPFDMLNGEAGQWIARASAYGFTIGTEPKLGAILETATHVAIVEEKVNDDLWYVSESGYDTLPPFSYSTSLYRENGVWKEAYVGGAVVNGFIYNPYVTDGPVPRRKMPFIYYLKNWNNEIF